MVSLPLRVVTREPRFRDRQVQSDSTALLFETLSFVFVESIHYKREIRYQYSRLGAQN